MKYDIDNIVAKLEFWINTWRDDNGRYNGPVVHRRDLKRLKNIHDTPWSQAEIINGFINLYHNTSNIQYLNYAISAAEAQILNMTETGEYRYAGHEDDRFSSLVHNALADCALLYLAETIIGVQQYKILYNRILYIVEKNIQLYFIDKLFDPCIGAFRFNTVDYYSTSVNRCVCNMNAIAAEAMIRLMKLNNNNFYDEYVSSIWNWIKQYICNEDGVCKGAISYSHVQKSVYISIYTALALRGLCYMYEYLKNENILISIKLAANNLISFMDNGMFMHESNNGCIYSKPWFISGSGMIFNGLHLANRFLNPRIDEERYLKKFLKYQLPNGAFLNFIGYDSIGNRLSNSKDGGIVWEDIFPTIGWNAQMFSYLTNYVSENYLSVNKMHNNLIIRRNFLYFECKHYSIVISLWPLRSVALLIYKKNRSKAVCSLNLLDLSRKIRGLK